MRRSVTKRSLTPIGLAVAVLSIGAALAASATAEREDYIREPLPPGFQVISTELDGPVFADAKGRTLYRWPDEQQNTPACYGEKQSLSTGAVTIYPGGYQLPDLALRKPCDEVWPPAFASAGAKAIGKWTIVDRKNGAKQWAYDGYAVYTSILDRAPGDVIGATNRRKAIGQGGRDPLGPAPNIPPQFSVTQVATGRLLSTTDGFSIYMWNKDASNKSNCDAACLREWAPVVAPDVAPAAMGEWSVFERSPGIKQWAFRGRPLYIHRTELNNRSLQGSDVPGWQNVYTQRAPSPPAHFTVQDTLAGQVLADERGRTIYVYNCVDDGADEQACDHPDTTQAYRLSMCGGGDPARCRQFFPYVVAAEGATNPNRIWTVMDIDPATGHRATAGQPGTLRVWAFRDRPVYSCSRDAQPGDIECDAWGELNGRRNGFKAFWLRYDYNDSTNAG